MVDVKQGNAKGNSRKAKAAATRSKILKSATELLAEHGYSGTTMQAIADHAGFAVQTVYFVFHTKGELVRQLLRELGGAEGEPMETMEREWVKEAITGPDSRRTIALMVEHGNDIYMRVVPVWDAIGQGAAIEPELAEVWDGIVEQRRRGVARIIQSIERRGHLRDGVTITRASDIVFGLQRPETLGIFVRERSWSLVEYKAWSYRMLCNELLDDAVGADIPDSPTRDLTFEADR